MLKLFKLLLLAIMLFAIYGGIATNEWYYPAWMITLSGLFYLCTFKRVRQIVDAISDLV